MLINLCQINPIVGDLEHNFTTMKQYIDEAEKQKADLVVFPELSLIGYPPEDLMLNSGFVDRCHEYIEKIIKLSSDYELGIIIGAPLKQDDKIYNCALLIQQGCIVGQTGKFNLPNYDVFDEPRIFANYTKQHIIFFQGVNLGLVICEDLWKEGIPELYKRQGADLLLCINASPFETGKSQQRMTIAQTVAKKNKLPVIYLNQIGGQDNLVFDGGTFAVDATGNLICPPYCFEEKVISLNFKEQKLSLVKTPRYNFMEDEVANIYQALMLGTRDYIRKNGFCKVLLGLSGGIDSALVAAIAADAIGADNLRCVFLPSQYSSTASAEDAALICQNLQCVFEVIEISELFKSNLKILNAHFKQEAKDITQENLQSRIRGLLLMAYSNQFNELLLSTGNKSEYACGYATIYGDMCGGFAPLKDVYKTMVYKLANWRNENIPLNSLLKKLNIIPSRVINRAPSAELKPNQTDQDTLPSYDKLDKMLYHLIELNQTVEELIKTGWDEQEVLKLAKMLKNAEFKRRQSAPGIKISAKDFAKGRRYPITTGF